MRTGKYRKVQFSIALIVLILLEIAVVVFLFIFLRYRENSRLHKTNNVTSSTFIDTLYQNLQNLNYVNHRNAAIIDILGPDISFDTYQHTLQLQFDSAADEVEAYEFIANVNQDGIDAFDEFCSAKVKKDCYLKQLNTTVTPLLSPTSSFESVKLDRSIYHPLVHVYPLSARFPFINNLIGLDITSRSEGIIEIEQFDSNGITSRLGLVAPSSNPYGSYGVALGYPTVSPLNTSIPTGYSALVIRLETIINKTLIANLFDRRNVYMTMFDVTEDGYTNVMSNNISLLYKENLKQYHNVWQPHDIIEYSVTKDLTFLNRSYKFYFDYTPHYQSSLRNSLTYVIPIIIIAACLLLDLIVLLIWNVRRRKLQILDGARANQMLSYVNHEINNPLNVIKGMVDNTLFRLDELPTPIEEYRSDLTVVARTCEFLEHIVSDILILQKLEEDILVVHPEVCNMHTILLDIIESVSQKKEENKAVDLKIECDTDLIVTADVFRLKQIMFNLVTNALKYTKQGSILIQACRNDHGVIITVKDTGIGISDKDKLSIFKPHEQKNIKDIGRHGQYGLGLYLVKILSMRMGWTVGFDSVFGEGSTFWVQIPIDNSSDIEQNM
jgi:signal transduction histidine kinase